MATTINSNTTDGLVITPDTSGDLNFQSNGTDVLTIDSSGNPTFTGQIASSNLPDLKTINSTSIVGTGNIEVGGGKVLQVVQTTFTGTQSVSTPSHGYFTNITNLQASITPSSTSSKILIMLNVSVMHPNDRIIHVKMSGGNSTSFIGNAASNRARAASWVSAQVYSSQMMSLMYLDSPNTTSPITYTPQMGANYTGTTWTINYNVINDSNLAYITRGASSMILMEIAG